MTRQQVCYPSIETPAVLVDMEKLEANIKEMSQMASEAGVRLRPHIKVHDSGYIARLQIEAGACGIEVGTIAKAEAMVKEGIRDIIIAHPSFYNKHKLGILKRFLERPELRITVMLDMIEQAEGLSQAGQVASKKVPVLLKIDTNLEAGGIQRYGILPGKPTLNVAKKLSQLPNIQVIGIYAHEMVTDWAAEAIDKAAFKTALIMAETAKCLNREGITTEHVSVGASSTFRATCRYIKEGKFPEITEIHPGSCVFGDIGYIMKGANMIETCALTVLTTVTSNSHLDWATIDAGFRTFSNDPLIEAQATPGFFYKGMPRFGYIQGHPDLWLGRLFTESAAIYYMDSKAGLTLGERLEIIPNNSILVTNMHDHIYGVRNGVVERVIKVTGRGMGI